MRVAKGQDKVTGPDRAKGPGPDVPIFELEYMALRALAELPALILEESGTAYSAGARAAAALAAARAQDLSRAMRPA